MNPLPSFTRVCARRSSNLAFRPASNTTRPSPSTITASTSCTTSRAAATPPALQHAPTTQRQTRHLSTTTISTSTATTTLPPPSLPPNKATTTPSKTPITKSPFLLVGTVTRTGTMTSCVQITRHRQIFDPFLQKHYTRPVRSLIHDPHPTGYLREGDVVEFGPWSLHERQARLQRKAEWEVKIAEEEEAAKKEGRRKKKRGGKKVERTRWRGPTMVVRRVVTAFGVGVDRRMEVLAEEEVERVRVRGVEAEKKVLARAQVGRKGRKGTTGVVGSRR